MYGNEAGVGEAVAASGLARDAVFVTTKLNNGNHRPTMPVGASRARSRPWASTTSTCSSSTGRARGRTRTGTSRPGGRSRSSPGRASPLDRRLELRGRASRATGRRDGRRARRQPDRAPSVLPES
jgi:hypothetical protein